MAYFVNGDPQQMDASPTTGVVFIFIEMNFAITGEIRMRKDSSRSIEWRVVSMGTTVKTDIKPKTVYTYIYRLSWWQVDLVECTISHNFQISEVKTYDYLSIIYPWQNYDVDDIVWRCWRYCTTANYLYDSLSKQSIFPARNRLADVTRSNYKCGPYTQLKQIRQ